MRAMARAGQGWLLLCLVAAVLPLLVQGFIPIQFHRPGKGDFVGGHRSGTAGDSGDVHPLPHLPPKFKHRFVHRPSKSLLEANEGEPHGFEIRPQWQHHFHRQHNRDDFTLAGERHGHRRDHAHFGNHHRREALPERMMWEHDVEEHHGHFREHGDLHKDHSHFREHGDLHKDHGYFREHGDLHMDHGHFRGHGDLHKDQGSRSGVWENVKETVGDSVSSLADRFHSVGDGIKNWFSQSKSRVAPTISFSAEPTWLGRLVSEPARASPTVSGTCSLDAKLAAVVTGVLSEEFSLEAQQTCAGMVEARTRLLKTALVRALESLCPGNLDAPCELQFCDFFIRHPKVAALMAMSKLRVNPVAVALKQDASSLCTDKDTRDLLHHTYHLKRRLHLQTSSIASPEGTFTCRACVDRSFKKFKHDIKAKVEQLCEKATCPKLRDSCAFVKKHKHLARTLFMLKLRPWEMVSDSCASLCGTTAFPDVLSGPRVLTDSAVDESSRPSHNWPRMGRHNPLRGTAGDFSFPLHHQHHLGEDCNRQAMGHDEGMYRQWRGDLPGVNGWIDADDLSRPHVVVIEFVRHRGVHSVFADLAKTMLEMAAKSDEVAEDSIVEAVEYGVVKEILKPDEENLRVMSPTSMDRVEISDTVRANIMKKFEAPAVSSADKHEESLEKKVDKTEPIQSRLVEELSHSDI